MNSIETTPRDHKAIVARYKSIGLFGGLLLGGLVGATIAGSNFSEWSGTRSLITLLGALALGGLVGYVAGEIAVGSLASGGGSGIGGGSDRGAGGGSGDGGGDGGGDS